MNDWEERLAELDPNNKFYTVNESQLEYVRDQIAKEADKEAAEQNKDDDDDQNPGPGGPPAGAGPSGPPGSNLNDSIFGEVTRELRVDENV